MEPMRGRGRGRVDPHVEMAGKVVVEMVRESLSACRDGG